MAARGAGASRSAFTVSPYRSRSNVRPSASVPEKAIAIHRMPAAASSRARPSRTNAKENTSTHATAKKSVVNRISRVLASIAKSFRSTSSATPANPTGGRLQPPAPPSCAPHHRAVPGSKAGRRRLVGDDPAVPHEHDARHEALGQIQIVRGHDDDGPL